MSEDSIFPSVCPETGWRIFFACAARGCTYLARTALWKHLYCAHPRRDDPEFSKPLLDKDENVVVDRLETETKSVQIRDLSELPLFDNC
jgi:hypothetical protein